MSRTRMRCWNGRWRPLTGFLRYDRAAMRLLSVLLLFCSLLSAQAALTPSEISEGWILLFDGETLFGWTPVGDAKWQAAGGALVPEGESGWLRANTPFADFALSC